MLPSCKPGQKGRRGRQRSALLQARRRRWRRATKDIRRGAAGVDAIWRVGRCPRLRLTFLEQVRSLHRVVQPVLRRPPGVAAALPEIQARATVRPTSTRRVRQFLKNFMGSSTMSAKRCFALDQFTAGATIPVGNTAMTGNCANTPTPYLGVLSLFGGALLPIAGVGCTAASSTIWLPWILNRLG